ncbi:MAG: hypothetical protein ACRC6V_01060 [Bacteroidales bacterium]
MTKLSLNQIEEANKLNYEWDILPSDEEIDETCYRNSYQRKELRSQRMRDDGEVVGKGSIRKHRKF